MLSCSSFFSNFLKKNKRAIFVIIAKTNLLKFATYSVDEKYDKRFMSFFLKNVALKERKTFCNNP